MARFTLPRDIYHGTGCLEELKNLKGKKAILVVGGGSMKRQGFLDKAVGYLKEAGMEVELFEGVEPDPSVETVMKGAEAMRKFEPDWIVSMGGGSPIDAAKAMWAFYEYPDTTFEDLCIPFNFPELRQKAKFCAIPTTSGTATEVTAFSVITNYQTGVKYPLADFNITPDVAIVDPDLVAGLPPKQVAYTGVAWKIVCCILSEILIFVWLTGRMIFFFRSINLPKRLEIKMKNSGFAKVEIPYCNNLKIEN